MPYGTSQGLTVLGRSKCKLTAGAGATLETVSDNAVRRLSMFTKEKVTVEGVISGGQTQEQIDESIAELVKKFPKVFKGLGRATGVPDIHIEVDDKIPPVQQKQRQVPFHYKDKLKNHLEELIKEGVVTPLECTNGTDGFTTWS